MNVKGRSLALALVLAIALPTMALAQIEGPRVSFSPHAGTTLWYTDIDLAQDVVYGARFALMPGSVLGVEGTVNMQRTVGASDPGLFNRITHVGADLIANLAPNSAVNPYLTGGWAMLHFDPGESGEKTFNAWEAGAGFKFRLAEGPGRRIDLRLDARNVFADLDAPFPNQRTQHNVFTSVGLEFGMGGTPRDTDGDGILDGEDDCPQTPLMAVVDGRGCAIDSDGDGVANGLDRCPETLAGATVGLGGCPTDTDNDGVVDGIDQCDGTQPGALVDAFGCTTDSDRDGVVDGIDRCPDSAMGALVDALGCVSDSDGDGVHDGADRCNNTPADMEVDEHGCPKPTSAQEVELLDTGMLRLDTVHFASSKWTLLPDSYAALDDVGRILVRWPQLRMEISGHTDSRGASDFNAELSQMRAQSVFDYLQDRFPSIQPSQYIVRGYGESKSIATNDSAEGRARNRRVEFRVLNREVLRR